MKYTLLTDTNTETVIYEYQRNYTWNESDFVQILQTTRSLFQKYPYSDSLVVELEATPFGNPDPDFHFCKVQLLKAWSDRKILERLREHQQRIIETIGYYLNKQIRKLDALISDNEYNAKTESHEPLLGEVQAKIEYLIDKWQKNKYGITFDPDAPDKNLSDLKPHKKICETCFKCNEYCISDEGNYYCNYSDVAPCQVKFKRYKSYLGDKPEPIKEKTSCADCESDVCIASPFETCYSKEGPKGEKGPDCCPSTESMREVCLGDEFI